jgi:hypothetical protein
VWDVYGVSCVPRSPGTSVDFDAGAAVAAHPQATQQREVVAVPTAKFLPPAGSAWNFQWKFCSLGTKLCVTELHPLEGSAHAGNAATRRRSSRGCFVAGELEPVGLVVVFPRLSERGDGRHDKPASGTRTSDLTQSKRRWWTCGFSSTTTRLVP